MIFRKFLSLFLVLALLCLPVPAEAAQEDSEAYIQRMIQYYLCYQEDADEEIGVILDHLKETDPVQGALWQGIMENWSYINSEMTITPKMLPDGLPEDDSLCIVIMGFGLNPDGTMQEELIDRLVVGLSSALKYPNAYVAVTGGATSQVEGVTEAGQMAKWLRQRGIEEERLIVENRAMSTVQNAQRVCRILSGSYPQVTSVAVVTSDYHIHRSCAMFAAAAQYAVTQYGASPLKLVGTAVNATDCKTESLVSQAQGICSITGISFDASPESLPELAD